MTKTLSCAPEDQPAVLDQAVSQFDQLERCDTTSPVIDRSLSQNQRTEPADGDAPSSQEDLAEQFEQRARREQHDQFQLLKDESRAVFGMVNGRPGVRSIAEWQKRLEEAGDDIGNGRFIVRCLGAERYLDAATVAVLVTLRQNLIAEAGPRTSTADIMMIDTAVVAYYNMLRVQGWIGNLSLVFEREAFGELPLNEVHGAAVGNRLREHLERLTETILPLQERAHRMIIRSLERLPRSARKNRPTSSDP